MPEKRQFWDEGSKAPSAREAIAYREDALNWRLDLDSAEIARVRIATLRKNVLEGLVPDYSHAELIVRNQPPIDLMGIQGGWLSPEVATGLSLPIPHHGYTAIVRGRIFRSGYECLDNGTERLWFSLKDVWRDSMADKGALTRIVPEAHAFQDPDFDLIMGVALLSWTGRLHGAN